MVVSWQENNHNNQLFSHLPKYHTYKDESSSNHTAAMCSPTVNWLMSIFSGSLLVVASDVGTVAVTGFVDDMAKENLDER